uniref:Uncharacterized protein n=1 Tax=Salix viminalis TaxID=40686 RepID=A0A6N2KFJ2_SALVM
MLLIVSPTFAMSGALAWQVKKPNKKERFLGFEGGDGTGLLSIFPGSPPSVFDRFLLSLSFYPLFCFCWKDTDKIANQTRKPSHQQGSALLTTLNHHPENVFWKTHCSCKHSAIFFLRLGIQGLLQHHDLLNSMLEFSMLSHCLSGQVLILEFT